MMVEVCVTA